MINAENRMLKKYFPMMIPCLVGVALAFVAISFYGFERVDFGDAADYIAAANSILEGLPYPRRGEFHPVFRAPVFPAFIAFIWSFFPGSVIAFKLGQALVHGGFCLAIFFVGRELTGKIPPAFLAAMICAVNPLFFGHTVDFYSEPLQNLLVAVSILILIKILKNRERIYGKSILLGVLFGLSTLCRPTILPILLCLIPLIFLLNIKTAEMRRSYFFASVLTAIGLCATVAPWTFSNYRATGEFIPVVNGFGYNFWLGNHPDTLRLYEGTFETKAENKAFADYWAGELPASKMRELEETDKLSSLPLNEREKVWRREAVENIRANPAITARLFFGKIKAYWTPFLNRLSYPFPLVILTAALMIGLYLLSPVGAYFLWRDYDGGKFVLLIVIQFILATLLHSLIIANVRYRTPYVDPYLAVLSAIAFCEITARLFPNYKFLRE